MSKSKSILFSAILLGTAPLMTTAFAEDAQQVQTPADNATQAPADAPATQVPGSQPSDAQGSSSGTQSQSSAHQMQDPKDHEQDNPAKPDPAHPYELKYFFADFQRFTPGSVVPDRYRTKKYEIVDWKTRNLPAPDADTNWTYMGGNYVLISKADGKILKVESGDIFYKQN